MDDFVIDMTLYPGLDSVEYDELEDSKRAGYESYIQRRLHQCSTFVVRVKEDPKTGELKSDYNRCGLAECPKCGPFIQEQLAKGIQEQLAFGSLKLHSVYTKEERARITRKYGKDNFSCYPVELKDGSIRYDYLIKTNDDIGKTVNSITDEQVSDWSKTVFCHAKSGKLCSAKNNSTTSEKNEEVIETRHEVEAEEYIIDFGQMEDNLKLCKEIVQTAIEETKELNPKTIAELESAQKIRRLKFREVVARHFGVILHVKRHIIYIRESDINWSNQSNAQLKQELSG